MTGDVAPVAFDGEGEDGLELFTEPNVALSLAERSGRSATVRVHLSAEARPPWLGRDASELDFFVSIDAPLSDLAAAVAVWDRELASFPARYGR